MRLGYACINTELPVRTDKTFRLASYTPKLFRETVSLNLAGLRTVLEYNANHGFQAFRISSNTIPFASHPIQTVDWRSEYRGELQDIGSYIKQQGMRISMHPGQYTVINSTNTRTVENAIQELIWHADFLDLLELDATAKIQIHVGGVFGDKSAAIDRWIKIFNRLPDAVKARLAIEHDERLFSIMDCLQIHNQTKVPIIFDSLHFAVLPDGLELEDALRATRATWNIEDGDPLLDYSDQAGGAKIGKHDEHIHLVEFTDFISTLQHTHDGAADIILEIKDKQKSALQAIEVIRQTLAG